MDSRLFEASRTGNLNHLSSLLQTDPLILETATLETGQTPLDISIISGHLDFAKEIIKLNPSFASEVNPSGLTPLHIASAKGEIEIVREIMKLGFHLCCLKGRESMIPLHCAVMKGRVEVIKEMCLACPELVLEVTGRGESVVHLAVKNSQFGALKEMVERLRDVGKLGSVMNLKDGNGNTALHVAVATKHFECLKWDSKRSNSGLLSLNLIAGMSDLCSPMIILLDNEADAFWCFERLMRRLRGNFRCTESSVGVETQLSNLADVTQVIDPKLHQHLETLGGGNYLFAFRMLMVLFRREFSFGDSLYLWEMMWALEYDPDLFLLYEEPLSVTEKGEGSKGKAKSIRQCGKFERENMRNGAKNSEAPPLPISVFLVASVLKDKSSKLLHEARGLDDVVKILNDMTGNLDAKKACTGAMKLHKKYLKAKKG